MTKIFPIIQGANPSIALSFTDAATDAAISLVGCAGFTGKAKHTISGTLAAFDSVIVTDAAGGKVSLNYSASALAETGLWSVQIRCTDGSGKVLILPSEEGQLMVRVGAACL